MRRKCPTCEPRVLGEATRQNWSRSVPSAAGSPTSANGSTAATDRRARVRGDLDQGLVSTIATASPSSASCGVSRRCSVGSAHPGPSRAKLCLSRTSQPRRPDERAQSCSESARQSSTARRSCEETALDGREGGGRGGDKRQNRIQMAGAARRRRPAGASRPVFPSSSQSESSARRSRGIGPRVTPVENDGEDESLE